MRELHLDFETRSRADLPKVGLYRYAEDPSTQVLMAAYSLPGGDDVALWVPAEGESIPFMLEDALLDPEVTIVAWNASFERVILREVLGYDIPASRFRCAMVQAWAVGLPGKLDVACEAAGLPADKQKLKTGRALIRKFCVPKKPTKKNPDEWWTKDTAPAQWEEFKQYCRMDVVSEKWIWHKLRKFRLSDFEQKLYVIDQEINDFGIAADLDLAKAAIEMGRTHREALVAQVQRLTGIENPNSTPQLKDWLNGRLAAASEEERAAAAELLDELDDLEADRITVEDLQKKTVERLLKNDKLDGLVRQVLELRQQIAKSSLKKYETILRAVCRDGRVRGMIQFYGAFRTGRWAGRLLQVQNLPSPTIENVELLAQARELVKAGDYQALRFMYHSVSDVLATLIRTALIAGPGRRLLDVDFSAIEAVILAWLSGCKWRLEVFRTHGKIYEASASTAFKVPFAEFKAYKDRTGKHHPLRKKGKVVELACLDAGVLVLTHRRGLQCLGDVDDTDKVWDGEKFVRHDGVVHRGMKNVISVDGIVCTPDHLFYKDGQWVRADSLPHEPASVDRTHTFDLLNCGPRSQFMVYGKTERHIVHNCGYQGGNGALIQMGALDMGIKEEELPEMVRAWRDASPEIEALWYAVENAMKKAIQNPGHVFRPDSKDLPADAAIRQFQFLVANGMLQARMPSGRKLCYIKPRLAKNAKGRVGIKYWGLHQKTKQWCELDTYGGKGAENLTQAFARDCLAVSMVKLYDMGYQMTMLVHDEIVFDLPLGFGSLKEVLGVMAEEIPFAKGLPLKGAGYDDAPFFYKD